MAKTNHNAQVHAQVATMLAAAVQPMVAQPAQASRANNALRFINHTLHWAKPCNWPAHVAASGQFSEKLCRDNLGVNFAQYKALGGSTSRLCYMVKHKCVVAKPVANG